MSKEQAKTWIISEFGKFYLDEQISLIIDSLTEWSFVSSVSKFVTANKSIAETEIKSMYTPEKAKLIIELLENLNYESMKMTYFTFYNGIDPNPLPQQPRGIKYLEYLSADKNCLLTYVADIFAGGLDLNLQETKDNIKNALDALEEIRDDIDVMKELLDAIIPSLDIK